MTVDYLEYSISQNDPVIVNIRPDPKSYNTHAMLAVGYDRTQNVLYFRHPSNCFRSLKVEEFLKRWKTDLARPRGMSCQSGFVVFHQ